MMDDEVQSRRHPIFQHQLFNTPEFAAYREKMKQHIASVQDPTEGFVTDPAVNTRLDSLSRRLHTYHTQTTTAQNKTNAGVGRVESQMSALNCNIGRSMMAAAAVFQSEEQQDATPSQNSGSPPPTTDVMDVKDVKVSRDHRTVTSMYNEFHGLAEFKDRPCHGGFAALEVKRKTGWRRGYDSRENQHFSKVKRIVEAVDDCTDLKAILEKFDAMYTEIRNVSKMVDLLKEGGYLVVKSRKKKRHGGGDP
jgi:hypothetical protein